MKDKMDNERLNKEKEREEAIRFVARHYEPGALDADAAWRRFASGHAIPRERSFARSRWMAVAAVLLALVAFGATYWWRQGQPDWVLVASGDVTTKVVLLPDSTRVTLAAHSSLRYDARHFGDEGRDVELRGKGLFRVTHDESSPFTAHTAHAAVRVLGTSFQIDCREDETRLDVRSGRVRFSATDDPALEPLVLTAGMSAAYRVGDASIRRLAETTDDVNRFSWENRVLRFHETPLEQVIRDVEDCYQTRIVNRGAASGVRLTSVYEAVPLPDLLAIINETLGVDLAVAE